jgi:hypothetical protein
MQHAQDLKDGTAAAEAARKPGERIRDWTPHWDESSEAWYYSNSVTDETVWDEPDVLYEAREAKEAAQKAKEEERELKRREKHNKKRQDLLDRLARKK